MTLHLGARTAARFRGSLDSVAGIVNHCELLLQAGADPWNRRKDLDLAAWEVVLQSALSEEQVRNRRMRESGRVLFSTDACLEWLETRSNDASSPFSRGRTIGDIEEECSGLNPNGVLSRLGYQVGESARNSLVTAERRRKALRDALCIRLDMIGGAAKRQWWGKAGTQSRLDAICRNLKLFRRLTEGRVLGDWQPAIDDWTADLEWVDQEWGPGGG